MKTLQCLAVRSKIIEGKEVSEKLDIPFAEVVRHANAIYIYEEAKQSSDPSASNESIESAKYSSANSSLTQSAMIQAFLENYGD